MVHTIVPFLWPIQPRVILILFHLIMAYLIIPCNGRFNVDILIYGLFNFKLLMGGGEDLEGREPEGQEPKNKKEQYVQILGETMPSPPKSPKSLIYCVFFGFGL